MIMDYEIDRLVRERECFLQLNKREYAYTYTRLIFMYTSRLLFAIGWNLLRDTSGVEGDSRVYENLFMRSNKARKNDSIEPGEYGFILRSLRGQKRCSAWLDDLITLLTEMGECRNRHMHPVTETGFTSFFNESNVIIQKLDTLFTNKTCEYIMPFGTRNEDGEYKAYCLRPEDRALGTTVYVRIQRWERTDQKLFYRVRDTMSGEVNLYCLSPFISYGSLEVFLYGRSFWVYQYIQNARYSDGNYDLYYTKMNPNLLKDELAEDGTVSGNFEGNVHSFCLSDLFVNRFVRENNNCDLWHQSQYNSKVRINISSYPGFDDILNNAYTYCDEICTIRKEVLTYCKNQNQQLLYICGNGGVGKTSLVLSIINQFYTVNEINPYTKKPIYGYTYLLFFSAKHKFYPVMLRDDVIAGTESDISSYNDFVRKISALLDVVFTEQKEKAYQEKLLLDQLERYNQKDRFLLVIDDLDSMPLDEQKEIVAFISQMNPQIVKTIITTRFLLDASPTCLRICELTSEQSIKYAQWLYENSYGERWNSWSKAKIAENIIVKDGSGNPLKIMILIAWIREGLEDNLNAPASKYEIASYFFSTIQNILNDYQKQLLEITRRIYAAFPPEIRDCEINKSILRYLCAGLDIGSEEFDKAYRRLQELRLIQQTTPYRLKLYDTFITDRRLLETGSVKIPEMYKKHIFEQIKKAPNDWINYSDTEKTMYNCIVEARNNRGSRYSGDVAMKIFECMAQSEDVSRSMSEKINNWINENSINTRPENVIERLIQAVENDWAELKELYDSGRRDEGIKERLDMNIQVLSRRQDVAEVQSRLKAVVMDRLNYQ